MAQNYLFIATSFYCNIVCKNVTCDMGLIVINFCFRCIRNRFQGSWSFDGCHRGPKDNEVLPDGGWRSHGHPQRDFTSQTTREIRPSEYCQVCCCHWCCIVVVVAVAVVEINMLLRILTGLLLPLMLLLL